MRTSFGLLALLAAAGCIAYEPRPLDPAASEAAYRNRSLEDPGLSAYAARERQAGVGAWPPAAWDFAALTLAAFWFHPELETARADVGVAAAAVGTAGEHPNPTLTLTPDYGIDTPSITSPWELGGGLWIPIETGGKREARIRLAEAGVEVARCQVLEAAWRVRSRLRAALVREGLARLRSSALGREVEARRLLARLTTQKFEAGEESRTILLAVEQDAGEAEREAVAQQAEAASAKAALPGAVGVASTAFEGRAVSPPDPESPWPGAGADAVQLQTLGLQSRLDMRRTLADYARAEAALDLEIAKQYPDISLGPAYKWDQGENRVALGLRFELPLWSRHEGPIAEAEARRAAAGARFLAVQGEAISRIEAALADWRGARDVLAAAERALQTRQERRELARRAFASGDQDRLFLVASEVEVAASERSRLDAVAALQTALGHLEDAVQRPLWPEQRLPDPLFLLPYSTPRSQS